MLRELVMSWLVVLVVLVVSVVSCAVLRGSCSSDSYLRWFTSYVVVVICVRMRVESCESMIRKVML